MEDPSLSLLFRLVPRKDVDVGQPFYALQSRRVDEPSSLPLVLWPPISHKLVDTRTSTLDKFLFFWSPLYSIYGIIWRHAPFGEDGKRRRKG